MKHFQSTHAQYSICTSYLQLIDICMQLFAGELTNQNREYYKVNDNSNYLTKNILRESLAIELHRSLAVSILVPSESIIL